MRIAICHDLPAGGALRFARDSVVSTSTEHTYVLFVARDASVDPALANAVDEVRIVDLPSLCDQLPGRAGVLSRLLAGQRMIARAIDQDSFDLALFHPSHTTQAPVAMSHVEDTPTLYFAQEPRRRSYERGYQPWIETRRGVGRITSGMLRDAHERLMTHLDRDAVANASVVATNSSFSVESIARAYGRDARLCHLGVQVHNRPLPGRHARRSLLSVGALDPTKGHDLVVEAIGALPAGDRPSLTFVHERVDPPFRVALERRASALGVALTIRRNVSDAELAELYMDASATVVAARLEPFGLTPLESMALGTPVLAVREGGFRETVTDGVNGVLVERRADALSAGIGVVLQLSEMIEPETIRKSILPYWSWDRCMDDFRVLLEQAAR
jgi:glycosyltransferase involved in cell wall biosynthesis